MKFKAQDKHNQRIENMSSLHLVVGVDIAQQMHVTRAESLFFSPILFFIGHQIPRESNQ
ncbi:hypothetical protein [Paenibacillus jilunlii]|uniref:Transposase n=1 Tax=Paenibacillus jilunlii TaxID=682956 RepID=A0A1G9QBS5_9BACL|nr:hypothetical protein [Paenibacillus jilunlii]SDM07907.1 hypothetical protein SAMN05216191_108180 [Paenibacillus jilunlii]